MRRLVAPSSLLLLLVVLLSPAGGLGAPVRASAGTAATEGPLAGWVSLTLAADKAMIFSARTTLSVAEKTHKGTGRPAVLFITESVARILGATGFSEKTTSWIDREKGQPIEFLQVRPGDNARRYVFLEGMVRQTNWEPPESSSSEDLEDWREVETVDRKLTFVDGTAPPSGEQLTDPYSLIYLLRHLDVAGSPGGREFTTIYRRHLMRVRVVPGATRRNEREVLNESTGKTEKLKLRERSVKVTPVGEGASSYRGLLGMQGDTEIWLDEESGALLEINGEAPGFGATQVLLQSFRR